MERNPHWTEGVQWGEAKPEKRDRNPHRTEGVQ